MRYFAIILIGLPLLIILFLLGGEFTELINRNNDENMRIVRYAFSIIGVDILIGGAFGVFYLIRLIITKQI